jgi:hypothetical protein
VTNALIADIFDCRLCSSLDVELGQLFDLLEFEQFDDGFQSLDLKVNSESRGFLQSKAERSACSLRSDAVLIQQGLMLQKSLQR